MMPIPVAEAEASIAGAKMPFLSKFSEAAMTAESVDLGRLRLPRTLRSPRILRSFSKGVMVEVFIPF